MMKTTHEAFGDEYTDRNRCGEKMIACRIANSAICLSRTDYVAKFFRNGKRNCSEPLIGTD